MKATVTVLFILSLFRLGFSFFRLHYFATPEMTWANGQKFCREKVDDISTVTAEEAQMLSNFTDVKYKYSWIGLYVNPINSEEWIWSGGQIVAIDNWDNGQPSTGECAAIKQSTSKFHSFPCSETLTVYCMKVYGPILVKENKTWDEALNYCRENYADIASLSSEEIMTEAVSNAVKSQTARVWTGLRFMAGHWFWVSGDNFQFKAWSAEGEPQCPAENMRCGALDRDEKVWKPTDCEIKNNFFCYKNP